MLRLYFLDTPTYIIIASFALFATVILFLIFLRTPRMRMLKTLFISASVIWLGITTLGEFIYNWAGNETCSKYLGCIDGFFGYDAFEHLFFGIAGAIFIIWLCERFPKYSILHSEWWKVGLTVVAVIALASVIWEMYECGYDALRVDILHETLRNFRIHLNLLDQPTNLDTMGDLTFSLVGSIIGFLLAFKKQNEA